MTVEELLERLKDLPPQAHVMWVGDGSPVLVTEVDVPVGDGPVELW